MANTKVKKRKRTAQINVASEKVHKVLGCVPTPPNALASNGVSNLSAIISEEEMEVTVDTLQTLAEHPNIIKSKPCKNLRAAVFDFKQACTTGVNTAMGSNLTARVSGALADGKYTDALIALAEMRIRNETPKVGALCRWVRDLDVVSGVNIRSDGCTRAIAPKSKPDLERMRVLDAILRVTGTPDLNIKDTDLASTDPIAVQSVWDLRDENSVRLPIRASVLDRSIFGDKEASYRESFQAIETTPGPERKPPNHHPAVIYLTSDNAVKLSEASPQISHHKHPHVPNLSLANDILSPSECKSIIAACEAIGFLPDAPIKEDGSAASILAHNVYWMVDQPFHDRLWSRVRPYVPSTLDGRQPRSVNRRFRVYRYVPGAEYRCHIDGAWPPSGIDPVTKAYRYDGSPPGAWQSSLLTFLIYLNDEFEGGETTFFVPSVREGVMNAYPVRPVMGAVAMFPHGETRGALLHEGTGVREGAKYIIRTDVEYDVGEASDSV